MMQQTGDAVASGNVAATFVSAGAKAGGSASGSPVTHALAQEAILHRTAQLMGLKGTGCGSGEDVAGGVAGRGGESAVGSREGFDAGVAGGGDGSGAVGVRSGAGIRGQGAGPRAKGERAERPRGRARGWCR